MHKKGDFEGSTGNGAVTMLMWVVCGKQGAQGVGSIDVTLNYEESWLSLQIAR
jgi:hypothetical protein